jgi:hypothetical protein
MELRYTNGQQMGVASQSMQKWKKITVRNSLDATERTVERKEAVACEKQTGAY